MTKLQIGILSAGLAIAAAGVWIGRRMPPTDQQPCQLSERDVVVKDPSSGKCWRTDPYGCTAAAPCPTPTRDTMPPVRWTGEKVRTP